MRHLILFQTYIEIFNKIEKVNLAALVVSSMTIVALVINEILKVSTGSCLSFSESPCACICSMVHIYAIFRSIYVCIHMCVCVCVRTCAELHSTTRCGNTNYY